MKVLLIGSGGREHAIATNLVRSARLGELVTAPGNAGTATLGRNVAVNVGELDDLLRVVSAEKPDITVIGPELPLSLGLADELERRSLAVFGPTAKAAMLESSKTFCKRFMQRHNIPTARYAACTSTREAEAALELFNAPVVVKADGLAAGKGVLICDSIPQAREAAHGLFSGKLLGTAVTSLVIEEFLEGEEVSFLLFSDGKHLAALPPAQDHKRIGEGDTGLNTGGMGAYTHARLLPAEMQDWVTTHIAQPAIDGMAAEDAPFKGVLYCGLMMTARGPMVLEFNARFGDPETQAILPRLESDLLEAMQATAEGRLSNTEFRWKPGASACVVASAPGYPGSYPTGSPITGLDEAARVEGAQIFHSGTALRNGTVTTAGGRVLVAAATAPELKTALERAYEALSKVHFDGMYYRHDIGYRAK